MSESTIVSSTADPSVTQRWLERFARFAQSGLSVAAFCKLERIAPSGFFRWRTKLASPHTRTHTKRTHTKRTHKHSTPMTTVVPMRLAPAPSSNAIELVLTNGTLVRFPTDTPPELLLAILGGLETTSC
jgi:hypothetical protein